MNWKQLLFPRPVRVLYKSLRRIKNRIVRRFWSGMLSLGWPRALAQDLGSRRNEAQVFLYKQGILSLTVGNRFLRFASGASARKLQKEYTCWQHLREQSLTSILPRSMDLRTEEYGTILEIDRLWPIRKEDQLAVTLPIVRELVSKARPLKYGMPETVGAGLQLAKRLAGGSLPRSFAEEDEIQNCFAGELLCGPTHGDLHFKNVMRDSDGCPVLIDLKSCAFRAPISLDLLTFACKYVQAREGHNTIEIAYAAQQCGWRFPELEPFLSFIDLERHLWGPVYLMHSIGRWAQKPDRVPGHVNVYGKVLRRLLTREWQATTV